jgi:protein TonB
MGALEPTTAALRTLAAPVGRRKAVSPNRVVGVACVLGLHAVAFWGLWANAWAPVTVMKESTVFVTLLAPADAPSNPVPSVQPRMTTPMASPMVNSETPSPLPIPPQNVAVVPAPTTSPSNSVSSIALEAAHVALPMAPSAPMVLATELSVACSERPAPTYPMQSRRLHESGVTVVRVELDETGRVVNAKVEATSGFTRLDEAALLAVRNWRCAPTQRSGQVVRATALQPFNFQLQ